MQCSVADIPCKKRGGLYPRFRRLCLVLHFCKQRSLKGNHWCQALFSGFSRLKLIKDQFFWEDDKNLWNLPYGFEIYVKTIRPIVQIFVAFSEELNFTKLHFFKDEVTAAVQHLVQKSLRAVKANSRKIWKFLSAKVCNEITVGHLFNLT